jgi:hypothetical protein
MSAAVSVLYLGKMITVSAVPNTCSPLGRRLYDYFADEAEQQEKLKDDGSLTFDAEQGWLIDSKRINNDSSFSGSEVGGYMRNEKRKRDDDDELPSADVLAEASSPFKAWTKENDAHLKGMKEGIEKKSWATIAKCFPGRTRQSCEQRSLSPSRSLSLSLSLTHISSLRADIIII